MRTKRLRLFVSSVVAAFLLLFNGATRAQWDARAVLGEVIRQFQTGTPNPRLYGQELWNIAAFQTAGTGIYPQLRQLGAVQRIDLIGQVPLPAGIIYRMTATHQNGQSFWDLGISSITNRIEYANFEVGANTPTSPSLRPSPAPKIDPQPQPSTPDPSASAACKKFPNLC